MLVTHRLRTTGRSVGQSVSPSVLSTLKGRTVRKVLESSFTRGLKARLELRVVTEGGWLATETGHMPRAK